MKFATHPRFSLAFKALILFGTIVTATSVMSTFFKTGAQQQETYPYQVFLYNGQPINSSSPPDPNISRRTVSPSEVEPGVVKPRLNSSEGPGSAHSQMPRLLGVSNPQPAILGTIGAGAQAVVFPDPGNSPATQSLIPGLPAGALPHGVSFYGSDNGLVSDFLNSRVFVVQVSTATLLSTINTATAGYDGTGTIAVAPNLTTALTIGSNNSLKVIQAPFGPGSAISSINLPGTVASYQTQAIVFNAAGRAFVYHTAGISVLDAPYTSIAFTMPVVNNSSGAIAISPDGNTLLTTTLSGNQPVRIFQAPFSAASPSTTLSIPGANGLDGIMIAPDGTRAIVVSAFTANAASIAAPFSSSSSVEALPLPSGSGGFEDVGISSDSQLAMLTGNGSGAPLVLLTAPFTASGATAVNVPITAGNPNRGNGAARFLPPGLAPGLTISKTAPPTAGSGGPLTYTINYANTGTVNASNVVITDPVPAGTTFSLATGGGTLSGSNVVWNIGTVNAGASGSVTFTVTVNAPTGSTVNNVNYTIQADGVAPIAGPPVATNITNSAPTITALPVTVQQATSGSATIANVSDAEDAENNLTVGIIGPATVNGVTISGISVDSAGGVTATVAASCTATNASFTLQVTDSGSLSATATLNVTVTLETTPPTINPVPNIVTVLPANSTATSMAVTYGVISASDNCSPPTLSVNPPSGSIFPVGTTTVTVTATDAAGNSSTLTFTVTVQYNFGGFGGRVPPPVIYAVAGNAFPVSFSLSGFKGMNIFAAGAPSSQQVNCATGAAIGASTQITFAAQLHYAPDRYTVYWQTNAAWAGTCRRFSLGLKDGTTRTLNFQFLNP